MRCVHAHAFMVTYIRGTFTEHIRVHYLAFAWTTFSCIPIALHFAPITFYDGPHYAYIRVHARRARNVVGANVNGMYEKRVGRRMWFASNVVRAECVRYFSHLFVHSLSIRMSGHSLTFA